MKYDCNHNEYVHCLYFMRRIVKLMVYSIDKNCINRYSKEKVLKYAYISCGYIINKTFRKTMYSIAKLVEVIMNYDVNIITEYVFLVIAILILTAMIYTKPRRTRIYHIDCAGMAMSVLQIVLSITIIGITREPEEFDSILFNIICALFMFNYLIILNLIFNYVLLLSPELKIKFRYIMITELIYDLGYCMYMGYGILAGKMYAYDGTSIILTDYFYSYLIFGILDSLYSWSTWIIGRRNMSRIVKIGVAILSPLDTILLMLQWYVRETCVFSSATYVFPFVIFYILFHSNPYNEIAGCQNEYSFETRFLDAIYLHKKYTIIYVKMTQFRVDGEIDFYNQRKYALSTKSRQIEHVSIKMHNYIISDKEFIVFIKSGEKDKVQGYVEQVYNILAEGLPYKNSVLHTDFKMLVMENTPYVNNMHMLKVFYDYMIKKMHNNYENEKYVCKDKDYEQFKEEYAIENMLVDIRNKMDLEDERVICYAQPIYSISTGTFRTAEALMRLKVDGRIIYPDKFIELAEHNGCIHALTCIILNKVCKEINELANTYDFDAITINCSTVEMEDENLYTELMKILNDNKVASSKIRLELTESTMSGNYEIVSENMRKLNQAGVKFYLDDFGTGYSNLERIVSFPFMTIKFDKSILYRAISDSTMNDLVDGIVGIFKKKGFVLLVEGVENEEHSKYSIDHGFDYIQGYKYAKPVQLEKLSEYFSKK